MRVKVSNPMLKVIRDALKGIATVSMERFTMDQYSRIVDFDLIKHTTDWNGDTFKAIRVDYAPELYALPAYITSWDLVKTFQESDGTLDSFTDHIRRQYAI